MKKLLRIGLKIVGVLLLLIAAVLAFGAWQYHQFMAIDTPNGIHEAGYVRINGIDQWVQIRGRDKSNPVLLWLNGGPGASTIPSTAAFTAWEKHFTVVMWDQRGEGRTYDRSGPSIAPTMTIDWMTRDGIELTNYLRNRIRKEKIVILGHSWGSILGAHMVRERPALFSAYIGTGQVRDMRADAAFTYSRLVGRARANKNESAVQELQAAGPPPYPDDATYIVPLRWANVLDPSIHASVPLSLWPAVLWEVLVSIRQIVSPGGDFSINQLWKAIMAENLSATVPRLDVPVIVIQGTEDLVTPNAKLWLDGVTSPRKAFLQIEGGGHLAVFARRDDFLALLVKHVIPLAK